MPELSEKLWGIIIGAAISIVAALIAVAGVLGASLLNTWTARKARENDLLKIKEANKHDFDRIEETNRRDLEKIKITNEHDLLKLEKLNNQENFKQLTVFRQGVLLQVIEQIEKFKDVESRFMQLTYERINFRDSEKQEPSELFSEWRKIYREASFFDISSAEAKLMLLGDFTASQKLREYGNLFIRFRNDITKDGSSLHIIKEEIRSFQDLLTEKRQQIYRIISADDDKSVSRLIDIDETQNKLEKVT